MVIAGVVQDHPSRRGAHRALSMADEEIGWKAKARAWVDESDSDSDNDEGSRKPHRGAHVTQGAAQTVDGGRHRLEALLQPRVCARAAWQSDATRQSEILRGM